MCDVNPNCAEQRDESTDDDDQLRAQVDRARDRAEQERTERNEAEQDHSVHRDGPTLNPILLAFSNRLRGRGKRTVQIVATIMRRMLILAYGVLESGSPFNAAPAS